jgi:DNA polymerase-1
MALLWQRRDECPGAVPVLFVHDEIVIEVDESRVEQAKAWLHRAMFDGMAPLLDPIPCKIDVVVCRTWAGTLIK